ncbi:MAG: CHRD domain-containing protein [Actinomycetota bacterium]|nr:CHRD domain-containing protein [Actinomycetota bacterium]
MIQHSKGARTMGRVGVCVAFVSSALLFAGPASAATERVATAHEHDSDQFSVYLSGDEVRDGGDRDGQGFARLDFDPARERVCYAITWRRLDGAVTALHLHASPRRSDGPHWIDFFDNQRFDGERSTVADCVRAPRWKIRAVIDDPFDYYLNVHTTAHKHGAIRGQLG